MQTYVNPLCGGQDPYTMKGPDGLYYSVFAGGNRGSSLYVAVSERLSEPGVARRVWSAVDGTWNAGSVWAPEIHYLRGRYYIYYTSAVLDCGISGWATRRLGVLEAEHPLGPYTDRGRLELGEEMSIDGTVLETPDGGLFFVYMRNLRFGDQLNTLCIAPMESPVKIAGKPVLISQPQYPWEEFVNEGPEALCCNGKIMIVYSAHGAHIPNYCLALLVCENDRDLLNRASWKKYDAPAFRMANGVMGPGHASMTVSPDGTTPYLVYHCKSNACSDFGAEGSMYRLVCVQPFGWHADGTPNFGEPLPLRTPMPLPSGEKEDDAGTLIDNAIRTDNRLLISHGAREYLTITEDVLYLNGCDRPEYGCKAMIRGLMWRDAAVAVDMRMPAGAGSGVLLRVRNAGARRYLMEGYAAVLSPRFGLEMLRIDSREPIRLGIAPVPFRRGDWVRLHVRMQGGTITAAVGDTSLTVQDDTYHAGRVGLVADGDLAWFKNMHVEALQDEQDHP